SGAGGRVVADPARDRFYAWSASGVQVYDAASNALVQTIALPAGLSPVNMAVAPGDPRLYVLATDGVTRRLLVYGAHAAAPPRAARLAFRVQPTSTTAVYRTIAAPVAAVVDSWGNVVTATSTVTVAIGSNPSFGTLSGTSTADTVGGFA